MPLSPARAPVALPSQRTLEIAAPVIKVPTILGLDPSLTAYGFALVTLEEQPRVLVAGCVRTKPDNASKHVYQADRDGARIDELARGLLDVLARKPSLVACEAPAGSQHANAAKALGMSYGLTRALLVAVDVSVITVQAHEVKVTIGGGKGASKDDVARGVTRITGWTSDAKNAPAREGEADAVGVALTAMRSPAADALRRAFGAEGAGAR